MAKNRVQNSGGYILNRAIWGVPQPVENDKNGDYTPSNMIKRWFIRVKMGCGYKLRWGKNGGVPSTQQVIRILPVALGVKKYAG